MEFFLHSLTAVTVIFIVVVMGVYCLSVWKEAKEERKIYSENKEEKGEDK